MSQCRRECRPCVSPESIASYITAIIIALIALLLFFKVGYFVFAPQLHMRLVHTNLIARPTTVLRPRVISKAVFDVSLKSAWFRISRFIRSP
jgi:small-conductance mechanosensitive channel